MRNKIFRLRSRREGFTLIELLVVIAIIGLLATIAVVALNSARESARDAKRIGDIRQVQTGLELYFNDNTAYPSCSTDQAIQDVDDNCDSTGITTFISGINNIYDPTEGDGGAACTDGSNDTCNYAYQTNNTDTSDYSMLFWLEGSSGTFGDGLHTATSAGIE